MIPLFLGLSAANILLLLISFGLGLSATDAGHSPTEMFSYHVAIGIATGLMTTLTHVSVYTYFMATSKWLHAAADKAGLAEGRYVQPSLARKKKIFAIVMAAIGVTVLTMIVGAASDPTVPDPWVPEGLHMAMAFLSLAVNAAAAAAQFPLIRWQGHLIDEALAGVNNTLSREAQHA